MGYGRRGGYRRNLVIYPWLCLYDRIFLGRLGGNVHSWMKSIGHGLAIKVFWFRRDRYVAI